jgi:NADPH2:quinone reductase
MKAVWYEKNGAAEVLQTGEMTDPEPGPGEVRVRVISSGVNPSDWKRRQGLTQPLGFHRVIPHQDGAGIIDRLGPGVPESRMGERVWLFESQFGRSFGTAAEYTAQPANHAVTLPPTITFDQGACLGVPAMTAHRCLYADGPISGKTVLVPGGAGAVGHYAVQEAKLGGATVISTVSSDNKARIAIEAGADHVINYRTEDTAARIMEITGGTGVDHIVEVDFAANFPVSQEVLKSSGVIAVYGAGVGQQTPVPLQFRSSNVTVRMVLVYDMPEAAKSAAVSDITRWLVAGALSHHIGPHFPLDEVIQAHQAVEGGAIGNVIVDVAAP